MADGDDKINGTTGGFTSAGLKAEEAALVLPAFDIAAALEIGQIAYELATTRGINPAIEVRIGEWIGAQSTRCFINGALFYSRKSFGRRDRY